MSDDEDRTPTPRRRPGEGVRIIGAEEAAAALEEGRIAVRNLRRAARHDLEAFEKDGDISVDELDRAEKELEKLTHEYVAEIDRMLGRKEQELLEV